MSEELIRVPKFKLDVVSLTMDEGATKEDWIKAGTILGKIHTASKFWIGDWFLIGASSGWTKSDKMEAYEELESITGLSHETLKSIVSTASRISVSRRRTDLSFEHHREVASLPAADQSKLLEYACSLGLTAKQVRDKIHGEEKFIAPSTIGFFYVIATIPHKDPRELKLGFTDQLARRLKQHQTTCPKAVIKKSWSCKFSWEVTVRDCLTASGCTSIGGEVYECDDIDALLKKGDELFAILPRV